MDYPPKWPQGFLLLEWGERGITPPRVIEIVGVTENGELIFDNIEEPSYSALFRVWINSRSMITDGETLWEWDLNMLRPTLQTWDYYPSESQMKALIDKFVDSIRCEN